MVASSKRSFVNGGSTTTMIYTYNNEGKVVAGTMVETGEVVSYEYTGGRLTRESYPGGYSKSYEYNSAGQLVKMTSEPGNPNGHHYLYEYNAFGQMIQETYQSNDCAPCVGQPVVYTYADEHSENPLTMTSMFSSGETHTQTFTYDEKLNPLRLLFGLSSYPKNNVSKVVEQTSLDPSLAIATNYTLEYNMQGMLTRTSPIVGPFSIAEQWEFTYTCK